MIYVYAFLFCGTVCALSQIVLEKTKFTPGHMNTLLVVIGCVLSGFGIYDKFIAMFGAGATVPIINFGHLLVTGAYEGFQTGGALGLFKGLMINTGAGISIAVVAAFIVTLLFKVKH